jgi:acetyl esterase/lipase
MRVRGSLWLLGCCLVLGVRSGPALPPNGGVTLVPYRDGLVLEHHVPSRPAAGAPVVVLVHGCCGDRRDTASLARSLARRGAVVLNPDVHAAGAGGGWPATYDDVACAVRTARAVADELAGEPHPVAVVGWADGALVGATVTFGWGQLAPRPSDCAAPLSPRGPDLLVGLAGYYGWEGRGVPSSLVTEATMAWFGTRPGSDPVPWRLGNPQWWLARAPDGGLPPVHLVAEEGDGHTQSFRQALTARGVSATVSTIEGSTHLGLVQPRHEAGAQALVAVCDALGLPNHLTSRGASLGE